MKVGDLVWFGDCPTLGMIIRIQNPPSEQDALYDVASVLVGGGKIVKVDVYDLVAITPHAK